MTEIYYLSCYRWSRVFAASALRLVSERGVGFVYWGRDVLQFRLPLSARKMLASLIGSSSNLYVLRKDIGNSGGNETGYRNLHDRST